MTSPLVTLITKCRKGDITPDEIQALEKIEREKDFETKLMTEFGLSKEEAHSIALECHFKGSRSDKIHALTQKIRGFARLWSEEYEFSLIPGPQLVALDRTERNQLRTWVFHRMVEYRKSSELSPSPEEYAEEIGKDLKMGKNPALSLIESVVNQYGFPP